MNPKQRTIWLIQVPLALAIIAAAAMTFSVVKGGADASSVMAANEIVLTTHTFMADMHESVLSLDQLKSTVRGAQGRFQRGRAAARKELEQMGKHVDVWPTSQSLADYGYVRDSATLCLSYLDVAEKQIANGNSEASNSTEKRLKHQLSALSYKVDRLVEPYRTQILASEISWHRDRMFQMYLGASVCVLLLFAFISSIFSVAHVPRDEAVGSSEPAVLAGVAQLLERLKQHHGDLAPEPSGSVNLNTANGAAPELTELQTLIDAITDATARKNSALTTGEKQLEKMKQEFSGLLASDFRKPLTDLLVNLDSVSRGMYGTLDDNGQFRVNADKQNCRRLIAMLSELLDLEKINVGCLELQLQTCLVQEVLEEASAAVFPLTAGRSVNLATVPCSSTQEIFADRERLIDVLINLLSDAITSSSPGSNVRLKASVVADFCEIKVTDQGGNFGSNLHAATDSSQSSSATHRRCDVVRGGLRLSIGRAIVEAHGGEIGVEAVEGRGCTVWIRLPVNHQSKLPEQSLETR